MAKLTMKLMVRVKISRVKKDGQVNQDCTFYCGLLSVIEGEQDANRTFYYTRERNTESIEARQTSISRFQREMRE